MALREEMEKQGDWLFRWRSYVPLIIVPLLLLALTHAEGLEKTVSHRAEALWEGFSLAVAVAGFAVRCFVGGTVPAGTSGRNTTEQIADQLNTTGAYSVVRHPLYVGNFLTMLGVALFTQVWWFVVISVLAFWVYYERIMFAEEAYLEAKFGEAFREWTKRTPAFIPRLSAWQPPALPFCWRTVLKREHTGILWITLAFALVDFLADGISEGHWRLDPTWGVALALGAAAYVVLLTLKKKTSVLAVEGR